LPITIESKRLASSVTAQGLKTAFQANAASHSLQSLIAAVGQKLPFTNILVFTLTPNISEPFRVQANRRFWCKTGKSLLAITFSRFRLRFQPEIHQKEKPAERIGRINHRLPETSEYR
jgi:hypothetical protein